MGTLYGKAAVQTAQVALAPRDMRAVKKFQNDQRAVARGAERVAQLRERQRFVRGKMRENGGADGFIGRAAQIHALRNGDKFTTGRQALKDLPRLGAVLRQKAGQNALRRFQRDRLGGRPLQQHIAQQELTFGKTHCKARERPAPAAAPQLSLPFQQGKERIGSRTSLQVFGKPLAVSAEAAAISATVAACEVMSRQKIGVLLAFERNVSLEEYFKTGTVVDARVSEQLLRNLFFPKAALHDGAAIIRGGRVAAAGCVMPLSENTHLSADLGTRHRAGVGTSEASDAVVVIVSEETGTISVAIGGMLKRHLAPQTLEKLLQNELLPKEDERDHNLLARLKNELNKRVGKHEGQ